MLLVLQGLLPLNAIIVSRRQQGNPALKHIRNVRWQFGDIVPDFLLGQNACALFLSLRYHLLHPEYIIHRIKQLQRAYRLNVLLVHVDVDDVIKPLADITKAAILHDCTMVCAWSDQVRQQVECLDPFSGVVCVCVDGGGGGQRGVQVAY